MSSPRPNQCCHRAVPPLECRTRRAGDEPGDEPRAPRIAVVAAVRVSGDEGGDLDHGKRGSHVGGLEAAELADRRTRCGRGPEVAHHPPTLGVIEALHPLWERELRPHPLNDVVPFLCCVGPRRVVGSEVRHPGIDQDERHRSLRVRCSEERRDRRALRGRDEHGAFTSDRVHDLRDVLRQRLEGWDIGRRESIRASPTPAIHDDQPSHRRESLEESGQVRVLPIEVDVRDPALHVHEIGRSLACDLVGERDVAVPRVACRGDVHGIHRPSGSPGTQS